ncbi:hypothetical protein HaLaN_05210, partial [Haematococcus lacustris]
MSCQSISWQRLASTALTFQMPRTCHTLHLYQSQYQAARAKRLLQSHPLVQMGLH